MELYGRVRRSVLVEGRSQREVAREFGISRKTIQKMLRYAVPPGYQRLQPVKRPKLGPWLGVIDAILEDDRQRPVKQRHTAKRIFDRLREEHGFGGGYTIVKDYVRTATLRGREMFVPLTHAAGEAQVDFGEALVVVAGVERKAHYLVMDLPHSDDCFVAAFPAETTEAFLEGHVRAFAYFGGVPTRILYDNTKIAVAKILGGAGAAENAGLLRVAEPLSVRRQVRASGEGQRQGQGGRAGRLCPAELHGADSARAQLGGAERAAGSTVPQRRERRLRGHAETIGERFERDRAALLPLPIAPYEACEKVAARVSSLALVRYRGNDYSVPTCHGHLQVIVKGYVHEVTIACGSEVIARHPRSYEREAVIYDPLHYLALLEQKTRALDQAAPLAGWQLPECFATLRRLLEARLQEARRPRVCAGAAVCWRPSRPVEVTGAIEDALQLGTISFDAVEHLLLCRIERRPPRLDMENYPHFPWPRYAPHRLPTTWRCSRERLHERWTRRVTCHSRDAADLAGTSPQGVASADHAARVRPRGAAVRGRGCRLSALSAAHGGAGTAGS